MSIKYLIFGKKSFPIVVFLSPLLQLPNHIFSALQGSVVRFVCFAPSSHFNWTETLDSSSPAERSSGPPRSQTPQDGRRTDEGRCDSEEPRRLRPDTSKSCQDTDGLALRVNLACYLTHRCPDNNEVS